MGARRTALALAAAVFAHALLAAFLPRAPAGAMAAPVLPHVNVIGDDVELDLDVDRAPPPAEAPRAARLSATEATEIRSLRGGLDARSRSSAATPPAGAGESATAPAPEPGTSDGPADWTFNPASLGSNALALGEHTGALARAAGVEVTPAEQRAAQSLTSAADEADRAAGHARGNALRDAIEQAARGTDAPTEGFARFEITIGPNRAAKVRLLDGSSDQAGWSRVLGAANVAARARTVRLPRDGSGLRLVVRVDAKLRLPDGRSHDDLGVRIEKRGLEYHESAGPNAPKITLPSATLKLGGKVCSLDLSTDLTKFPITGGCNPDAIGTRLTRQVATKIESEERVSLAAE